jgi:hypothetical protein
LILQKKQQSDRQRTSPNETSGQRVASAAL